MESAATRACLGFTAGAIAVLTFHQGLAEVFYLLGLPSLGGYRTTPTWPFGLPAIVNLSAAGGIYGAVFAVMRSHLPRSLWRQGLVLGFVSGLLALFVMAPLKGHGFAYHGLVWPMARAMLLNITWGFGVGVILPLLRPRPLTRPATTMHAVRA